MVRRKNDDCTARRRNTINVVSMDPNLNSGFTRSIAGGPCNEYLIGPFAGAWGRVPKELGRVACILMDDGTASSPTEGPTQAKPLRAELQPLQTFSLTNHRNTVYILRCEM